MKAGVYMQAKKDRTLLCDPKSVTSGIMHYGGVLLSVLGLVLLYMRCASLGAPPMYYAAFSVYGAALILLYGASGTYHTFHISDKVHRTLKKIDHCMVYVLVAGSYTPICLIALRGWVGWTLIGIVWGLALGGIILKVAWIDAPRWLSSLTYILMGWVVVFAIVPVYHSMALAGIVWLVVGGIIYTIGGVFYALKIPRINTRYFGAHEFFHILVLLGSACHYVVMYFYVL